LEDAADILAAQRADTVSPRRPGQDAPLQMLLLLGSQRALATAAGFVEQSVGAVSVVTDDPGANLAGRKQNLGASLLGGLPQQDEANGSQSPGNLGV
jgi:hypothetical protein